MDLISLDTTRSLFIDFFKNKDHVHCPYSPLIPDKDDSLMFVNSGMVQFKNIFIQDQSKEYKKVVTYQKCLRAGGKHNDLENVGYTQRHHTFFEMLGNFSFGQYFKEESILYCWEFLTKVLGLAKDKLVVTVFENDEESYDLWKKVANISDNRIIKLRENFWSMGDFGPCGPCSEVFFDNGSHIFGGMPGTVNEDGNRYMEIWNMVFMQFNRLDNRNTVPLSMNSVDTGMGIERINAVLNNVADNYKIPFFQSMIDNISDIAKVKPTKSNLPSFKIISDHIRAVAFLVAEDVVPGNEGRGYVLRKIMRRMILHEKKISNKSNSIFSHIIENLISNMGTAYPEIIDVKQTIIDAVHNEVEQFSRTIQKGFHMLSGHLSNVNNGILSGKMAFSMHDTYGFPIESTVDFCKERNITVDFDGFYRCMEDQKKLSRSEQKFKQKCLNISDKNFDDSGFDQTDFVGYTENSVFSEVQGIFYEGNFINKLHDQQSSFILVAAKTPFFGESGGQVGDFGYITNKDSGLVIRVCDTQKTKNEVFLHNCVLESGYVEVNQQIKLEIDIERRRSIMINHSAAHILFASLIRLLGNDVKQKGFYASEEKFKLDFNCSRALTNSEIVKIEKDINQIIMQGIKLTHKEMDFDSAIKEGALYFEAESYKNVVRVIEISNNESVFSKELCGGTHVKNTSEIGNFKIISEKSIGSGIRRIEAVTGMQALHYNQKTHLILHGFTNLLSVNQDQLIDKLKATIESNKFLSSELKRLQLECVVIKKEHIKSFLHKTKFGNLLFRVLDIACLDQKIVSQVIMRLVNDDNVDCAIFVCPQKQDFKLTLALSKMKSKQFNSGEIIKKIGGEFSNIISGQSVFSTMEISNKYFDLDKILKNSLDVLNTYFLD